MTSIQKELRSIEGSSSTMVTFTNKSSRNIVMVWLNYHSEPIKYSQLVPGASYTQQTYVTHPWIAVELDSGYYTLMLLNNWTVFYPQACDCNVHITEPQGLAIKECLDPKYHYVVN
jgi:hypothetical protein